MLSRLKSALKRSPQDPPLVVEFDQRQSYTAGSTVSGVVHLQLTGEDAGGLDVDYKGKGRMRGGSGRKAIDQVVVRLRVLQVSTYQHIGGQGMSLYAGGSDYRTQHRLLLAEDQVLWRSDSPVDPPPFGPSSYASTSSGLEGMHAHALKRTLSPRSMTSDTSVDEGGLLTMAFSFRLPSWADQQATRSYLPPSFEGGSRSQAGELGIGLTVGNAVGRTAYYIKVVGVRSSKLARDEKIIRPFLYFPPTAIDPSEVPEPILAAPGEEGSLPIQPPSAPVGPRWRTVHTEKHVRMGGLMSAKGLIRIDMVAPALPILPPHHPVPFHLTMVVQSPPVEAADEPPLLRIPPPSTLSFDLIRTVDTHAHGASQKIRQFVDKVGDIENERRVWYGDKELVDTLGEDGQPERRWSCTITVVGEFYLGGPRARRQGILSPSFPCPSNGGLGCKYSLTLHLPLKGTTSDFWVEEFLPLAISSRVMAVDEEDALPAYFNDDDPHDDLDFEEDKKMA